MGKTVIVAGKKVMGHEDSLMESVVIRDVASIFCDSIIRSEPASVVAFRVILDEPGLHGVASL